MGNQLIARKPRFTFTRSASPTPGMMESEVRRGEGIPYLSARAASIPAVVADAFPKDSYCLLRDFFSALEKVVEALQACAPAGSASFVMIERKVALKTALTLVLGGLKTSQMLGSEFDPTRAINESLEEVQDTVLKVQELLKNSDDPNTTIERFRESIEALANPRLAKKVLKALSMNAPTLLRSDGTEIQLALDRERLTDLPSGKNHVLEVVVKAGFDEESRVASVAVVSIVDADKSFFSVGDSIRILCIDEQMRLSILLAQAAKKTLRVVVSIPRCPITPTPYLTSATTLEEASILDLDNSDALKLLAEQLKLFA